MYKSLAQEDRVKLVIVDLDNTLWRGVIAEDKIIDNLTIEGWPLGLVEALLFLKKRGILLAIASKNDEANIRRIWPEVMNNRLSLDDFACIKINWNSKVENVEDILNFTNILPRHTIFIDDNPVERASVNAAFPEIRVLGQYPYYLKRILLWSPETQVPTVTSESASRTELLHAKGERDVLRKTMSGEEFIASLQIKISAAEITSSQHLSFPRALELLNKTNQFNTTGKRWTKEECDEYFGCGNGFYAFKVRDRFSDYGLVGVAAISLNHIDQFVMSCRVLGLGIEQQVIADIMAHMSQAGATEIYGHMEHTKDNFPCRNLYEKCAFENKNNLWAAPLVSSLNKQI